MKTTMSCKTCATVKPLDAFRQVTATLTVPHSRGTLRTHENAPATRERPGAWPTPLERTDVPEATKMCQKCGTTKVLEHFNRCARSVDGRRGWCSPCEAARTRRYRAAKPKAERSRYNYTERLRRNFGLTVDQYEQMAETQGHCCAICGLPETGRSNQRNGEVRRLNVDHDHSTGKVRALLCNRCNRAFWMLNDDPVLLARATAYLETHA